MTVENKITINAGACCYRGVDALLTSLL